MTPSRQHRVRLGVRPIGVLGWLGLLVWPLTALAHTKGGEALGFSSGMQHPMSGLDHVLAMMVGLMLVPHESPAWLTCGLTIVLGALVAAAWQGPLPVVIGGAVLLGLTHGCVNGAGLAQTPSGVLGMAGIASALFVVVALLAGPVVVLRAVWARIVVRMGGT